MNKNGAWGYHRGEWAKTDIDVFYGHDTWEDEVVQKHWDEQDAMGDEVTGDFKIYSPRSDIGWEYLVHFSFTNRCFFILAKDEPDMLELAVKYLPLVTTNSMQWCLSELREGFEALHGRDVRRAKRQEEEHWKRWRSLVKSKTKTTSTS